MLVKQGASVKEPREKQACDATGHPRWALCTICAAYAGVKMAVAGDIPVRYSCITMQANAGSDVPADKAQGDPCRCSRNLRLRGLPLASLDKTAFRLSDEVLGLCRH